MTGVQAIRTAATRGTAVNRVPDKCQRLELRMPCFMCRRSIQLAALLIVLALSGCYRSGAKPDGDSDPRPEDALVDPVDDHGCRHHVCDILPQCGCPIGAMCSIDSAGVRVCALAGVDREGSPCTELECAPGLLCDEGVCRRACHEDDDCIGSVECVHGIAGEEIRMCNVTCELLPNSGCPSGFRCDFYQSESRDDFFSDCYLSISEGSEGEECQYFWHLGLGSSDCALGLSCYYSIDLDQGFCQPYCPEIDLDSPSEYCSMEQPCCTEPVRATSNGTTYYTCREEHYCSL
jgi:hypothetical protein